MTNIVINNYRSIEQDIKNHKSEGNSCNVIAVSKTFSIEKILPLIQDGHVHFGENKVQEALLKWTDTKKNFPKIKLHMIGKLQTNKVKKAFQIFDYIHSLDNKKLADTIKSNEEITKKKLKYFIQVNTGQEIQKSGISFSELENFFIYCKNDLKLNVIGLMAIPPNDGNEESHFKNLYQSGVSLGLKELSMGMSSDYKKALKYNTTFLRIGSLIFGKRNQ